MRSRNPAPGCRTSAERGRAVALTYVETEISVQEGVIPLDPPAVKRPDRKPALSNAEFFRNRDRTHPRPKSPERRWDARGGTLLHSFALTTTVHL